jgi:hypothetical protein
MKEKNYTTSIKTLFLIAPLTFISLTASAEDYYRIHTKNAGIVQQAGSQIDQVKVENKEGYVINFYKENNVIYTNNLENVDSITFVSPEQEVYSEVSTIRPDPNTTALWVEGNWTDRWPMYLTCDVYENLFIVDNGKILVKIDKQKLDAGEKSWAVLAQTGINETSSMNGVFTSADGKQVFLVEDRWDEKPQWKKIHVFDPENNWALQHVNTGINPSDIGRVLSTMAVDENGVFYFMDSGSKKFYKLVAPNRSPEGTGEGGEGKDNLVGNSLEILYDFSSVVNADLYGAIYCLAYSQIDKRVYFSTYDESVIRYWDIPSGTWHLLAGSTPGYAEGTGAEAQFNQPNQIAVDKNGNVIVADRGNHCIRRITPAGETSVIAGMPGVAGYNDGDPASALFNNPYGVCISPKDGSAIYVSDLLNYKIRKIAAQ